VTQTKDSILIRSLLKLHQYLPIPWLIVGLLFILFFVFVLQPKQEQQTTPYGDSSSFPQFYMETIETREFDTQGQLHYQLNTPQVTHFQIDPKAVSNADYTLIKQPKMQFYGDKQQTPWLLSAQWGRSESNGQLLRLFEQVEIQQTSAHQGLLQITTGELRVRVEEQFAETDKAVKMRSAKGQIDAVGMNAQLSESRIELTSQVKAVYEPR
jgi:lipopolysaccharide export system protein LptC